MSSSPDQTQRLPLLGWLANQPYLLLSLTSLFWAGNVVLGRFVAGHAPPIALATLRWGGAFLVILPFAWPHLKREWPVIRANLPMLILLAVTGIGAYNTIAYIGLQYTSALNALLIRVGGAAVRRVLVAGSVPHAFDHRPGARHRQSLAEF